MNLHPIARALQQENEAKHFYALIGKRAEFTERMASLSRRYWTMDVAGKDAEVLQLASDMQLLAVALDAVETELRALSPNITFDRMGEACLVPSKSDTRATSEK